MLYRRVGFPYGHRHGHGITLDATLQSGHAEGGVSTLTKRGEEHLEEWMAVLGDISKAIAHFVRIAQAQRRQAKAERVGLG